MPSSVLDFRFEGDGSPAEAVASALHELPVQWARDHRPSSSTRLVGGPVGCRVRLSPGAVQLTYSRADGWERERMRAAELDALTSELALCVSQLNRLDVRLWRDSDRWFGEWDYFAERERWAEREADVRHRLGLLSVRGRGRVGEWSRRSRARMTRRLATLDWRPMTPTATRVPAMLTLTYPGDYLAVCPTGEVAKRQLKAFRAWWVRRTGDDHGVWKLERQRRGAPHFHLLVMVPRAGLGLAELRHDARLAWARIVSATGKDRARHERAGVSIDIGEGSRYSDPQRIAVYFSKHNAASVESAKAYQNLAPDGWIDPEDGGGVGRWWGYWRLRPVEIDAELHQDDADAIRRILRGWVRSQRRVRRVKRKRIKRSSGVVTYRTVTQRYDVRALSGVRPAGFVLSSDAPALVSAIGRAIAVPADWPPGEPRPLP